MALLIKINPNIIGITIKGTECKWTQFANDTTLFLDGSLHSLQSALNMLEIFGKKRNSKTKLPITEKLDWDNSEFTLLGIEFSTNLNRIPEMNFSKSIKKVKTSLKQW